MIQGWLSGLRDREMPDHWRQEGIYHNRGGDDMNEKNTEELLKVCKQAWSLLQSYGEKSEIEYRTETIVKRALRAAIAKAEGGGSDARQ